MDKVTYLLNNIEKLANQTEDSFLRRIATLRTKNSSNKRKSQSSNVIPFTPRLPRSELPLEN